MDPQGMNYGKGVNGMHWSDRKPLYIGLALMLCLSTAGCGHWRWPRLGKAKAASDLQIAPSNNRYSLTRPLTADDIVTMMLNIGFSEKQTVELGESLRNALMSSGAAEVRRGKNVEASFAVYENDCIYIATRKGGVSIYDVRRGQFGLGQGTPSSTP
jgi:hypothetical protein